jgi:hypothetical protein
MSITGTKSESNHINRRAMLVLVHNSLLVTVAVPVAPVQAMEDANALINELKECKRKMMTIPELLKQQEWDSVRTILKTPPVNRLWNLGDVSFHVDDVFLGSMFPKNIYIYLFCQNKPHSYAFQPAFDPYILISHNN